MKALMLKKEGEVLGEISFVTYEAEIGRCLYWAFYSQHVGLSLKSHRPFITEAAALAHFEKHFGRIIREGV